MLLYSSPCLPFRLAATVASSPHSLLYCVFAFFTTWFCDVQQAQQPSPYIPVLCGQHTIPHIFYYCHYGKYSVYSYRLHTTKRRRNGVPTCVIRFLPLVRWRITLFKFLTTYPVAASATVFFATATPVDGRHTLTTAF